jgi:nucleoid DNA-binding protein
VRNPQTGARLTVTPKRVPFFADRIRLEAIQKLEENPAATNAILHVTC